MSHSLSQRPRPRIFITVISLCFGETIIIQTETGKGHKALKVSEYQQDIKRFCFFRALVTLIL